MRYSSRGGKQMSINYLKYQDDLRLTYNNVIDALEDFEKKTNNENK